MHDFDSLVMAEDVETEEQPSSVSGFYHVGVRITYDLGSKFLAPGEVVKIKDTDGNLGKDQVGAVVTLTHWKPGLDASIRPLRESRFKDWVWRKRLDRLALFSPDGDGPVSERLAASVRASSDRFSYFDDTPDRARSLRPRFLIPADPERLARHYRTDTDTVIDNLRLSKLMVLAERTERWFSDVPQGPVFFLQPRNVTPQKAWNIEAEIRARFLFTDLYVGYQREVLAGKFPALTRPVGHGGFGMQSLKAEQAARQDLADMWSELDVWSDINLRVNLGLSRPSRRR